MNKRVLALAIIGILALSALMTITPAMAKTKTDVYVKQVGSINFDSAERQLEPADDKITLLWGVDGTGVATLYEDDKTTVIDTFVTSSEIFMKDRESDTMGFRNGFMVAHFKMLWVSNTYQGSGFEGIAQWRATDDTPHAVTISALYQGYGQYSGQVLQIDGAWILSKPSYQSLTGTLLA